MSYCQGCADHAAEIAAKDETIANIRENAKLVVAAKDELIRQYTEKLEKASQDYWAKHNQMEEMRQQYEAKLSQAESALAAANARHEEVVADLEREKGVAEGKLAEARELIRTLWDVGKFSQSVGNALSEDGRLKAAYAAAPKGGSQ